ncbi:hypothetical protein [Phycisphaera mikurensis]|uniref:Uncharacterized protein n=1 Tax=Phycisphaera mikurensis (strain NBRC 102666 / KCTC 22515 / FYK2301M01) TaxID=1142394 RepID=I0IDP0_PHYMF|nr:hypothetical protein [Phycisphaera mikurensis]MBB6441195.1 hypothetical protein [Phycisphaera mikurensis]BAM03378.1 hypothetical protein PSMK_12190 [Phycisphaera mikurensis NBRC 102666]
MRGTLFCTPALLSAALLAGTSATAQADADLQDESLIERLGGQATQQNLDAPGRSSTQMVVPEPIVDETTMGISASVGGAYNTHFVSYGFDIWGAGTDFGDNATFNPTFDLAIDLGSEILGEDFAPLVASFGIWADINNNAPDTIGGDLQEVDFYYGLGSGYGDFAFSVTYQQWIYAGAVEQVLDLGIAYDDSGLWDNGFAFNPSVLIHKRLSGANANFTGEDGVTPRSSNGFAYLLGVEPAFDIIDNDAFPMSLSIPVVVAFGDDEFYTEAGFAYVSVGAQFAFPLSFIPADLGEWGVSAGVTGYFTDEDAIGNVDDSFLTGNVGLSLAF